VPLWVFDCAAQRSRAIRPRCYRSTLRRQCFYGDLSEFFFAWLRLGCARIFEKGSPEGKLFQPENTPRAIEAVSNPFEHPDDRLDYERDFLVRESTLAEVRRKTGQHSLEVGDKNPFIAESLPQSFTAQS